jgi:hypothetical protein
MAKDEPKPKEPTRIGFKTPRSNPEVADPRKKDGPMSSTEGKHLFGKSKKE